MESLMARDRFPGDVAQADLWSGVVRDYLSLGFWPLRTTSVTVFVASPAREMLIRITARGARCRCRKAVSTTVLWPVLMTPLCGQPPPTQVPRTLAWAGTRLTVRAVNSVHEGEAARVRVK